MSLSSLTSHDGGKYGRIWRPTSSRDALSAIAMQLFTDECLSLFAAWTMLCHNYFCHKKTTMTSETSENKVFVQFYFTLFYLMLAKKQFVPKLWSHLQGYSVSKQITGWPQRMGRTQKNLLCYLDISVMIIWSLPPHFENQIFSYVQAQLWSWVWNR